MIKTNFLLVVFMSIICSCVAQDKKINFKEIKDITNLENTIKKSKKMIFLDVYAEWCGPCKMMDRYVFSDKKVANCFNQNYTNIKVDLDNSLGRNLANKYRINGIPTYLILDSKKDIKLRIIGARSKKEMLRICEANS